MKSEYNKGLQKAIRECKKLYQVCVENMDDCSRCHYYTKKCASKCRVFDELIEKLEGLKQ